jgi:hypothetical protein
MNRLLCSFPVGVVVLVWAALGAGCKPSVTLAPVSGKVTMDGQPVTAGQVSLIPMDDKTLKDLCTGSIENGEYKIFTGGSEGAPLGKYKVTVTPSMVPTGGAKSPSMPFNRKFSEANSTPLTIEVVSSPAAGAYDLKLTK